MHRLPPRRAPALRSCLASRRGASPTVAAERQGRASGESLVMRSRWLALPPPGATGIKGCPRYGLCSFVVPPRFRACAAGTLDTRTLRRLVVGIGFALAKPSWHWFANGNKSLLADRPARCESPRSPDVLKSCGRAEEGDTQAAGDVLEGCGGIWQGMPSEALAKGGGGRSRLGLSLAWTILLGSCE